MNKSTESFLAVAAVLVILLSAIAVLSFEPKAHAFEFEAEGVRFGSDVMHPGEQLRALAKRDSFLVTSEFLERGTTSFMTQPITLANSVFVVQGKFVIVVAQTLDSQGNILSCDTNDGDKLTNRPLTALECRELLDNPAHTLFLVKLPNPALSKPKVTVSQNKVVMEPKSFEDVSRMSFLVLRTMYSDSQQTIDLINDLVDRVTPA